MCAAARSNASSIEEIIAGRTTAWSGKREGQERKDDESRLKPTGQRPGTRKVMRRGRPFLHSCLLSGFGLCHPFGLLRYRACTCSGRPRVLLQGAVEDRARRRHLAVGLPPCARATIRSRVPGAQRACRCPARAALRPNRPAQQRCDGEEQKEKQRRQGRRGAGYGGQASAGQRPLHPSCGNVVLARGGEAFRLQIHGDFPRGAPIQVCVRHLDEGTLDRATIAGDIHAGVSIL